MRSISALFLSAACAVASAADHDIRVDAHTEGGAVRVEASARLRVPHALLWQTLTDYDHLNTFIPSMASSRVIERRGVAAIVEQTGEARFLLFTYPLNVTVASEEYPPNSIRIHALKGNLRRLDGGYEIVPREGGEFELRWEGVIEPDLFLPALVTRPFLRAVVEAQFRGMVAEIQRRSDARNP